MSNINYNIPIASTTLIPGNSINDTKNVETLKVETLTDGVATLNNNKFSGLVDPTSSTDLATKNYVDTEVGGAGDVKGPASAVDSQIVIFDGTTGKLVKDNTSSCSITGDGIVVGDLKKLDLQANGNHVKLAVRQPFASPHDYTLFFPDTIGSQFDVLSRTGDVGVGNQGLEWRTPPWLELAGGTMTGDINMGQNNINECSFIGNTLNPLDISCPGNTTYASTSGPHFLSLEHSGSIGALIQTTAKNITLNPGDNVVDCVSSTVTNVLDPIAPQDVATKNYVDTEITSATSNSYAEAYFNQNATVTTIVSANTPVAVGGTFNGGLNNNFTVSAAGIVTYTGTPTITVKYSANWTWEVDAGTAEEVFAIVRKNGVDISKSRIETKLNDTAANYPRNSGLNFLDTLSTNDTLQFFVAVINDTDDLLFQSMQQNITQV